MSKANKTAAATASKPAAKTRKSAAPKAKAEAKAETVRKTKNMVLGTGYAGLKEKRPYVNQQGEAAEATTDEVFLVAGNVGIAEDNKGEVTSLDLRALVANLRPWVTGEGKFAPSIQKRDDKEIEGLPNATIRFHESAGIDMAALRRNLGENQIPVVVEVPKKRGEGMTEVAVAWGHWSKEGNLVLEPTKQAREILPQAEVSTKGKDGQPRISLRVRNVSILKDRKAEREATK